LESGLLAGDATVESGFDTGGLDRDIGGTVKRSPIGRAMDDRLTSVSEAGEMTSRTRIAGSREPDQPNRRRIASLVGVAPVNPDSGQKRGRRRVAGGGGGVRDALLMATQVPTPRNPVVRHHDFALVARGRLKKKWRWWPARGAF
jgi:transposase